METLTIIGTGPAGLTAAIYAARANLNPLLLAGSLPGGQLTQTTDIENYPGFPDAISGFELMDAFQKQAERFGARIQNELVEKSELTSAGPQKLHLSSGDVIESRAVIIATGASARSLGIPSEDPLRNKGVSYCATCDGAFFREVPIVVVGGGDSALEEAMFLTRFASKVILVHRRDELRGSKIMRERAFANPKIEFCWNSTVEEVLDVAQDKVTAVVVKNKLSGELSTIECGAVFVAIGHVPNTAPFKGQIEIEDTGYIKLQGDSSRTNVEGVFAAGDCADHTYRQAITAAGMGCRAAIDAERWLAE